MKGALRLKDQRSLVQHLWFSNVLSPLVLFWFWMMFQKKRWWPCKWPISATLEQPPKQPRAQRPLSTSGPAIASSPWTPATPAAPSCRTTWRPCFGRWPWWCRTMWRGFGRFFGMKNGGWQVDLGWKKDGNSRPKAMIAEIKLYSYGFQAKSTAKTWRLRWFATELRLGFWDSEFFFLRLCRCPIISTKDCDNLQATWPKRTKCHMISRRFIRQWWCWLPRPFWPLYWIVSTISIHILQQVGDMNLLNMVHCPRLKKSNTV